MRLEVGSEDWGAAERKPARLEGTFSPGHHQRHPPYNLRYSPTNHGTDFCGQQRWARIEPERRGHRHRCRHYSGRPESQLRPSDLVGAAVTPVARRPMPLWRVFGDEAARPGAIRSPGGAIITTLRPGSGPSSQYKPLGRRSDIIWPKGVIDEHTILHQSTD